MNQDRRPTPRGPGLEIRTRLPLILVVGLGLLGMTAPILAGPPAEVPDRYQAAVAAIDVYIARELSEKRLPALSIALVDDQEIVWSKGYGIADPETGKPATPDTVYRVGSVSKLFTDLAVMQLVEKGTMDLDEPIRKYLPDFAPKDPFGDPITLRELMAHRSGLTREPPVGHYFDPTGPTLEVTIASLDSTELIYRPKTRQKYSNAAIAAVGLALQKSEGKPFDQIVAERVLGPIGMSRSAFVPTPTIREGLAKGTMWTYHDREFPAPTFELGIAPAGCMYSTVTDLARFLEVLFAGGNGPGGRVLKPETLHSMFKVQFAKPGQETGFGLGFSVSRFRDLRRIGHGGAIYGFATEVAALPDQKLGVVVIVAKDCANAEAERIADAALDQMLAVRQGKPLTKIDTTNPLPPGLARKWEGTYQSGSDRFELTEAAGRLYMTPESGGSRVELRSIDGDFLGDDILGSGPRLILEGEKLKVGGEIYDRIRTSVPAPPDRSLVGLIGEYGWDHDILYIYERQGRLYALIEWFFLYPLTEVSPDVYRFPDDGLYDGEKLEFRRDANGRATEVEAGSVVFRRRSLDGEDGRTFRIIPRRPVEEIRRESVDARPPTESGNFRESDLVDLSEVVPGLKLDIRYATTNNFLGVPLYNTARALMQRPAAEALARVQARLAPLGYGLLVHDAYRPWRVTKLFWEATPPAQRVFVADPSKGSRHNRGCAVDLTLCDLATGRPIEMVSGYDEFSDRAYPQYPGGTSRQRWHRDLLRRLMEEEGYSVYEAEWWHFDYSGWQSYPILDTRFEDLAIPGRP
ncbi:serine hydrolase [Tundrisphaera lichenicola]|uniref:serine hydrolase n=1 Tax=Tundrisphaera lichenicola TaxID=2029860 RepID=UPI003EBF81EC